MTKFNISFAMDGFFIGDEEQNIFCSVAETSLKKHCAFGEYKMKFPI